MSYPNYDKGIAAWQQEVHAWANSKGWWESDRPFGDLIANVHAEVSEAWEEYRNGHGIDEVYIKDGKPEGIPIELADTVIRILDIAEAYGIDLDAAMRQKMTYNQTRAYRHGGKLA